MFASTMVSQRVKQIIDSLYSEFSTDAARKNNVFTAKLQTGTHQNGMESKHQLHAPDK